MFKAIINRLFPISPFIQGLAEAMIEQPLSFRTSIRPDTLTISPREGLAAMFGVQVRAVGSRFMVRSHMVPEGYDLTWRETRLMRKAILGFIDARQAAIRTEVAAIKSA